MSGIHLDHGAALQALSRLLLDGEEQHRRHLSTRPALPVAALGRDFAAHGAQIAAMLHRVHDTGRERIDALRTTAESAAAQVRVFGDIDKHLGAHLRGVH
ncbi:hypothetical protein B842_02060 [Corynebacterium humireducens NBRC 106098 = DSM 45392]|uniref:Uncharacterized protein n=1 Tax=Corynebacterium humireducens NBRC 106098 = DSM 45392 TaxID=1223515 RepID=A0A0B5D0C4_9CORY|nr:hypothetical protein [Corynebacterium humireducens]AJE32265.1 hypothetical protein B842_02060 [Corynebacterium humireducens NBRC 106098 = DSM 45392]